MSNESILIVEDEQIVAEDLGESLRHMGYTVCSIESTGESAVTAAATLLPDLILMDIFLAGPMNGIDAAVKIIPTSGSPDHFPDCFCGCPDRRAGKNHPAIWVHPQAFRRTGIKNID